MIRQRVRRRGKRLRALNVEALERREMLDGTPVISEFMAVNNSTLKDEDGDYSDWIELFNPSTTPVNLQGYWLTDQSDDLTGWRLPSVTLSPGSYQLVFASGKNRDDADGQLHTDFRLNNGGEYLALVAPDGETVLHEYAPTYPPQIADIAYGVAPDVRQTMLVGASVSAKYRVPTDNSEQTVWPSVDFDDFDWPSGTTGFGYDTGGPEADPMVESILALGPLGYWRFEEVTATPAVNSGTLGAALNGTYSGMSSSAYTALGPGTNEPLFAFGNNNSATSFDGRNDYVSTTQPVLSNRSQFTMVGLIKPDPLTNGRLGLFGQNDVVEFGFINPTTLQVWTAGGGAVDVAYGRPFSEWHHVAVVGDGTGLHVYIDGELAGSGGVPTGNYGASSFNFNMGGGGIFDATGNFFDGVLDEVAVFDKALTLEQIRSLLNLEGQGGGGGDAAFGDYITTNVQTAMYNQGSSLYVRIPFNVNDPSLFNQLSLSLRYDDGFVAYINGGEVARRNAPGEEDEPLPFDAVASRTQADRDAVIPEVIDISDSRDLLHHGANVLAIHLLNAARDNPDLLLLPQLEAAIVTVDPDQFGYLTQPTPGKNNNPVSENLGPLVQSVTHAPHEPTREQSIIVMAQVMRTLQNISSVNLVYRVMYGAEATLPMVDNGIAPDSVAGDGIYTATIPGNIAQPGNMIRWFVRATDTLGGTGRLPTFEVTTGDERSPEYLGTLVVDPSIQSEIPILHWWVQNETAAGTRTGTRAQLYYNGEFYDNMFVRERGASTSGAPKDSFKFDFDQERFRFDPAYGRVEEFNLNSTFSDKAYARQALAFQAYSLVGAASSISFPIHVQRNNQFYGVFNFIEEPDDEMLEREGLDDNGALYKIYDEFLSAGGARKKTRQDEDRSDLQNFITQVNTLQGDALRAYLFDNVDLPATLNYLVGTVLVHQNDNPHKNHFLYRDTEGSGEWQFLPWDHDLTWGANWVGTSYSDWIYADVDEITYGPVPSWDLSLISPSHPLVNTEQHREWNNHWNRLMDALLNDPVIRQMYLRRLRTAMDELLGPPGTDNSVFDQLWDGYLQQMTADAALDKQRWANPRWSWGADLTFPQAVEIIKQDYLAVRRQHLYLTHNIDNLNQGEIQTLVPEFTQGRYFVPSNNALGTSWTTLGFNDSSWTTGQTAIGYENTPSSFRDLIKTQVKPTNTVPDGTSIFVRIPFNINDPSQIKNLVLRMKYDDGFVAYLNGVEVARPSTVNDGPQNYNSTTRTHATTAALKYEDFVITQYISQLRPGQNVLAIHALNGSASSSDMFVLPVLIDGIIRNVQIAGIPHGQQGNPAIRFDSTGFDATPASGNQDEEYVKLDNPTDVAVDISGWRLSGGIEHTFRPGTTIPAGMSLYVSPNVRVFRARTVGPAGGQTLLVQGDYDGHLSGRGETIQLVAADGALMDTLVTPDESTDAQRFLRITEVYYNPRALDDETEFIELQNISTGAQARTLDLSGVTLSDGPRDPFVIPQGVQLAPGQYALIVNNVAAFRAAYPAVSPTRILGEYTGNLSNQGELIKLDDAQGNTIVEFSYGTNDPWPERADGSGASLVLIDPAGTLPEQLGKYYRWRGSTEAGGSPAAAAAPAIGIVVNEVLSNADPAVEPLDAIELYNPTDQAVAIGGWYLSDSGANPRKYRIDAGTVLGAGEYLVIDETEFNPRPGDPGPNDFALSGTAGDDVWLFILDANGQITSFVDDVHFGAAVLGESFGRWPDAVGRITPMFQLTLAARNDYPRVGPLVISEVQYHPGAPTAAARRANPDVTENDLEFIEIFNPTSAAVSLSGWQIRGGVEFDFELPRTIAAGRSLLVLSFDPAAPDSAYRLAAFRAQYGLDASVALIGGYSGQLSDSGGDPVRLLRPGTASPEAPNLIPYLQVDEVLYDDLMPWPTAADGSGASLQRTSAVVYGNDAASWQAADATPGQFDPGTIRGDFNRDAVVDAADINLLFVQLRSPAPDLSYDLMGDAAVTTADRDELIINILNSTYGDADLNQVFSSEDFVFVFQAGQYEDTVALNSLWETGDWNGDGEFDSQDFVIAFQAGEYSLQVRPVAARSQTVAPVAAALNDLARFWEGEAPAEPQGVLGNTARREPRPPNTVSRITQGHLAPLVRIESSAPVAATAFQSLGASEPSRGPQPLELVDAAIESLFGAETETARDGDAVMEDLFGLCALAPLREI